jgi:hypothetical protein
MEKVVHRIWPSGVCRTVPRSNQFQQFCLVISTYHIILTSDLAVSVRIPRCMEASGSPCEVDDGQPLALEIAPVQTVVFIVIAMAGIWHFDLRDVPLDSDQSDSYKKRTHQWMRLHVHSLRHPTYPLLCLSVVVRRLPWRLARS